MACGSFQRNCVSSQHRAGHGELLSRGLEVPIPFWSPQHLLLLAGPRAFIRPAVGAASHSGREDRQPSSVTWRSCNMTRRNGRLPGSRVPLPSGRSSMEGHCCLSPNLVCQNSRIQASGVLQLQGLGCSRKERGAAGWAGRQGRLPAWGCWV